MQSEKMMKVTEKILNEIADNHGFTNTRLEFSLATNKADNFVGEVYRCVIKNEDDPNRRLHLIVKVPPSNEERRKALRIDRYFDAEIHMYKRVLPALANYYKKRNVPQHDMMFLGTARTYALLDEDEDKLIVMEDLKHRGFVMKNRRVALDADHCRFVLRSIARLHAASLALQRDEPELHDNLTENFKELQFHGDKISKVFLLANNDFRNQIDDRFPLGTPVRDKVELFLENFQENMKNLLKRNSTLCCIIHGDLWTNNILFKYKEDSEVLEDVCIVDFQIARMTSPVIDIAYFLSLCTTKESRKSYTDLVKWYHDNLCYSLRDLGHDPEEIVPWTLLEEEMKKYSRFGWAIAVASLPYILLEDDDVELLEKREASQHSDDKQQGLDDRVKMRYIELLEEAEELGYL